MKRLIITTVLIWLTSIHLLSAQDLIYESGGEMTWQQGVFIVHHYDLNLKVNPADSTVSGSVTVDFRMAHPSNEIELALDPSLTVEGIYLSGDRDYPLRFSHGDDGKRLLIWLPQTVQRDENASVEVVYSGKPRVAGNPPWDGGMVWDRTPSGEPWVGVATQIDGAWIWWPNKDHPGDKPDSVSVNLTMPDDLVVASNGRSRGVTDHGNGWKTSHWFVSTPINNYNITLNAAPYELIEGTYQSVAGDETDMILWILPEYREEGEWLFEQMDEQMQFLEEILGPYPFRGDKYGVAHAPYLGMEHQSLIAYGANFQNDNLFGQNAGYDDLLQHELAHEWWGNLVSAWDWRDFWIHEGIGTYMQPLYAEHLGGQESYREMMEFLRTRIVSRTEVVPRDLKTTLEISGGGRGGDVYYKGAWFMHTLRYLVGDEDFFTILRRFAYPTEELEQTTDGSAVRYATTDDLLWLVEAITGMDLDWLFEVYLRQPDLPELQKEYNDGELRLSWLVPEGLSFDMPVEVEVDGERVRVDMDSGSGVVSAPSESSITVDPDHWILRAVRK